MHVAFVIFRGEPHRGGAERYVDTLGHALVARGHRVSVLASTHGSQRGLHPVTIGASGLTRTARYRRFLRNLDTHLHRERYDIVHACMPVNHCDVYHAHAGLEAVSLQESHEINSSTAGQLASMLGNRLNHKRKTFARVEAGLLNGPRPPVTICLSDRERRLAEQMFVASRSKLVTMYSVPDDERFTLEHADERRQQLRKRLGVSESTAMFLFVGQDFRRKGLGTAIRALGEGGDPNSILYVLGEGDMNRYTQAALKAGVVGRVLFAGAVDNVPDFLAAADALVFPTRYEPFGMVTVEAMLMGVPPIVSGVAGSSEVIKDGLTGYVIPSPTDAPAWAQAMRKLADPAVRAALSKACLGERSRFSYAAHVDAMEALYARIVSERA
jgi:UDP-glucose:(heptosyl)LPS alpha-1,3-glucosyltransferase